MRLVVLGFLASVLVGVAPVQAGVLVTAAAGPDVESAIAGHLDAICDVGPTTREEGLILQPDLDGDGVNDLVLDTGMVRCGDGMRANSCGFRACEILIFLARGDTFELNRTVLSIGVDIVEGTPPRLALVGHNFEEGQWAWDGTGFSDPAEAGGTVVAAAGAAEARWTYGNHPVLGLTAHIDLGDNAIGIACAYFGDNPAVVDLSALRVTPGLVRDGAFTARAEPSGAGGTRQMTPQGGYFETRGNSCDLNTMEWRNGSSVSVLDTAITGYSMVEGGNEITLADGTIIPPGGDVLATAGGFSVPLKGSAAAIDQLLRACPMLQQDIDWECGI